MPNAGHIGIDVTDLDRSRALSMDVFGFSGKAPVAGAPSGGFF